MWMMEGGKWVNSHLSSTFTPILLFILKEKRKHPKMVGLGRKHLGPHQNHPPPPPTPPPNQTTPPFKILSYFLVSIFYSSTNHSNQTHLRNSS